MLLIWLLPRAIYAANYPGLLANVLSQLPKTVDGAELARVKIFTSLDDNLSLDIFRFGVQGTRLAKTQGIYRLCHI